VVLTTGYHALGEMSWGSWKQTWWVYDLTA
jgi:hypothetical protein